MLKGINPILTGELLLALDGTGHHDTIAVVDGNFPALSKAGIHPVVTITGHTVHEVVAAVLEVVPVSRGGYISGDHKSLTEKPMAREFESLMQCHGPMRSDLSFSPRQFYKEASKAAVIIATRDPRHWGCFLLTRGVLPDPAVDEHETSALAEFGHSSEHE